MFRILAFILLISCAYGGVTRRGLIPLLDGRIYGGSDAVLGQIPFQASMRFWGFHRCGGVICRTDAVITAAHCVHGLSADSLEISVGTIYRNRFGQERGIRLILKHENFDEQQFNNDIAILLLEKTLDFSDTIQPIALANSKDELREGTKALVSGWGTLDEIGHLPDVLQYVDITIVDNAKCADAYKNENPVTENMICAGERVGGKDSCQGDSGGPLIVGRKLYGIVSWGAGCADPDYPGVYTKIAAYRTWITEQLNW